MREVRLEAGTRIELTSLRTRRRVGCKVEKLLGIGGTAKVYAGITDEGHQVVLKAQRWEGQPDPSFEVEVELFKKLFHRNIVHCVGVANTGGGHLVLGFRRAYQNPLLLLTKASVARRDRLATYPSLPIDTAIDFTYELLNALDYLERLGFVHHDVKLANILVDVSPRDRPLTGSEVFGEVERRSYRGVLIDFGATRSRAYLEAWNRGEAPDGLAPLITPIYAPPEALVESRQADGEVRVTFDPSLDVYAAALVIYALVTGHPPYSHLRAKLNLNDLEEVITVKSAERRAELVPISQEVIQRAVFEDTRFVNGDRASFDLALFRFLAQRLSPDPAQRGTAADMKRDFERLACIRQLRDDAAPPSGAARGASSGSGSTASATRPVFLPFQQELVVVGGKGEHPLLRAARSFGVGNEPAESATPIPEPLTPTPEGDTAAASDDELDWLASMGEGKPQPAAPANASWLNAMDATGPTGAAARRTPVRTRRMGPDAPPGAPPAQRNDESGRRSAARGGPPPSTAGEPPSSRAGGPSRGKTDSGAARAPQRARPPAPPRGRGAPPPGARPAVPAPAAPAAEAGQAAHCLVGPALGDPVLLSRERRYVIGRDPGVELRIRSDLISRRHAEVSWTGKGFQVLDLGSLNGTLVNGQRITTPTMLQDGDRIGVGGFEITVRTLQGGTAPGGGAAVDCPEAGETRVMMAGVDSPSGTAFAGDLEKLAMREVVGVIESRRQSGTLAVRPSKGTSGKLYFRQGLLVHAELRGQSARDAALRLLGLERGRFVFSAGDPGCPRSLDVTHERLWAEVAKAAGKPS